MPRLNRAKARRFREVSKRIADAENGASKFMAKYGRNPRAALAFLGQNSALRHRYAFHLAENPRIYMDQWDPIVIVELNIPKEKQGRLPMMGFVDSPEIEGIGKVKLLFHLGNSKTADELTTAHEEEHINIHFAKGTPAEMIGASRRQFRGLRRKEEAKKAVCMVTERWLLDEITAMFAEFRREHGQTWVGFERFLLPRKNSHPDKLARFKPHQIFEGSLDSLMSKNFTSDGLFTPKESSAIIKEFKMDAMGELDMLIKDINAAMDSGVSFGKIQCTLREGTWASVMGQFRFLASAKQMGLSDTETDRMWQRELLKRQRRERKHARKK
jgi:hypothetical protein